MRSLNAFKELRPGDVIHHCAVIFMIIEEPITTKIGGAGGALVRAVQVLDNSEYEIHQLKPAWILHRPDSVALYVYYQVDEPRTAARYSWCGSANTLFTLITHDCSRSFNCESFETLGPFT